MLWTLLVTKLLIYVYFDSVNHKLAFPKGLVSAPGRPRVAPNSPVVFDVSLEYIPGLESDEEWNSLLKFRLKYEIHTHAFMWWCLISIFICCKKSLSFSVPSPFDPQTFYLFSIVEERWCLITQDYKSLIIFSEFEMNVLNSMRCLSYRFFVRKWMF